MQTAQAVQAPRGCGEHGLSQEVDGAQRGWWAQKKGDLVGS